WVLPLKEYFHYPRPFVVLPEGSFRLVTVDVSPEQAWMAFPSGHSAFAMMMVAGLWPALGARGRVLAAGYLLLVGWSRIALGVHFPADVLGGFFFAFIAVCAVRLLVGLFFSIMRKSFAKG